jgi:hypothetical protein
MSTNPMDDTGLDFGISSRIRDEPGYRVQFDVEQFPEDQAMEMVLRMSDRLTWWKSLSYFPYVQGWSPTGQEIRIETKDRTKEARQLLYGPNLSSMGMFSLWKAGTFNFGAYVGQMPINGWANRGRRIIFTWLED